MDFVRGLFENLGKLVQADRLQLPYHQQSPESLHVTLQVEAEDDMLAPEDEDQQQPPLDESLYTTDEEANDAFANGYIAYMQSFYGRPLRYRTDLYCAMFPVDMLDVKMDDQRTQRYWWFTVVHPVADVLSRHFRNHKTHCSEGIFSTKRFGSCVVYSEEVVEFFIDYMMEMCAHRGIVLEDVRSEYGVKRYAEEVAELEAQAKDLVYDYNGQEKPIANPIIKSWTTEEGSKKSE